MLTSTARAQNGATFGRALVFLEAARVLPDDNAHDILDAG